jgi:hypothetical protein
VVGAPPCRRAVVAGGDDGAFDLGVVDCQGSRRPIDDSSHRRSWGRFRGGWLSGSRRWATTLTIEEAGGGGSPAVGDRGTT